MKQPHVENEYQNKLQCLETDIAIYLVSTWSFLVQYY